MEEGTNAANAQPTETGSNTVVPLTLSNEGTANPITPNTAPLDIAAPPPVAGNESTADPGYTIGTWAGRPNYLCAACPFATLEEAEIRDHVLSHRVAPPAPPAEPTHT